ncbi:unnamed protein product, partial [Adineta steineri]
SLDEMKKKQEEIILAREQQLAREKEAKLSESMRNKLNNRKDTGAHQRPNKLSFADEWDEEEEEHDNEPVIKKQPVKIEENITTDDNSLSDDVPKNEDVDSNDSIPQEELTSAELDRLVAASKKKRLGKNP